MIGGLNAAQSYQGLANGVASQGLDSEKALRDELLAFIQKTKQLMGANSEEYQKFKNNCKDSAGNNDTVQCLKMIQDSLRPHNDLMDDLNKLLPPRFQVEDAVDMNNAIEFIHQIKEKTTGIYQRFIDTLKKHDKKEINMFQMNNIIQDLMKPYPNLLDQFKRFLPAFTQSESVEEKPPQQQAPQPTKGKKGLKQVQQKQEAEKQQVQQPVPQATKKSLGGKVNQSTVAASSSINTKSRQQQQEVDEQIAQNEIIYNQSSLNNALAAQSQIKSFPKTEQAFFEKLRVSLRDDGIYDEIMKCFFCYIEGVLNQYEFFELISHHFDRNNEEILLAMKNLVGQRDTSRRNHNLLCKPFSEFDTSHFKKISYSYYEMPQDFPRPICSGRSRPDIKQLCKQIFNDDYSSLPTGSESFKFKTKNQYEDVLFRLEDEMFKADHEVGNFLKTMKVLEEEKNKIDKMDQTEKENYKIDPLKFNVIRMKWIEKTYGEMGQEIIKLIPQNPIKAIPIIYDRFKTNYTRAVEEKEEQLKGWHETCEKNFHKSLDHRSFHFKFYEKKSSMPKAYLNEIKSLASSCLKSKNLNQLKGGCKDSPFFGTYAAFEPICVHSYESMNTPEIKQDHPINLEDLSLLDNAEILPQMRFLINDENKFNLAFQLVLAGIRIVSYNSTEKEKARTTLKNILEQFFNINNYIELREVSSALVYLAEEQIDVICTQDYYEAKQKGIFSFTRTDIPLSELRLKLSDQLEANQALLQQQQQQQPIQAQKDEEEIKNGGGGGGTAGNSQKQQDDVLSPEPKVNANKNSMTQQLKPIQLQSNEQDTTIITSPVFVPYYKPGYKLMICTQNHYIFFKQVYTVYERLIKARDLINSKVDEDLILRGSEALNVNADAYKTERFDTFIGGILSAMSGNMDTGKYEDFARQLLGSRAYLLFAFDKLITATVKQILSIANDEASQKSFAVYQKFQNSNSMKQAREIGVNETLFNESIYLSHFAAAMADVNNYSGVGIRLLFSPLSKILTIHYFSTNSFNLQDTKKLYQEVNTYIENQTLDEVNHQPAIPSMYLKRQVKMVAKIRKIEDVHISNQIIPRIQPQVYRMQFDANSEDILLVRRKTKLKIEEEFMHDIKVRLKFDQLKRMKYDEISNNNGNTTSTNNSAAGLNHANSSGGLASNNNINNSNSNNNNIDANFGGGGGPNEDGDEPMSRGADADALQQQQQQEQQQQQQQQQQQ